MIFNLHFLRRFSVLAGAMALVTTLSATDVPKNLGNGLDKLVESRLAVKKAQASNAKIQTFGAGFATEQAANYDALAIKDRTPDRYIVDIHPSGRVSLDTLKQMLATKFPTFKITAVDEKYRDVGVIEGYMSIDDVAAAANLWEIRSIQLGLKPYVKRARVSNVPKLLAPSAPNAPSAVTALNFVGTAFDQGVTQHRVDKISSIYDSSHVGPAYNGEGITLGGISNSYDTRTAAPHAAQDVASFDLPGAAGNPVNTQPVFLVEDATSPDTDEARAIIQILFKMAPKARMGVATANLGEVDFANNIRKLANVIPNGASPAFKADAICDDVGYFDEPWFQDGIIGAGVDDVYAAGVAYFSSAANDIGTNAYTSVIRWVPNGTGNTAATNTALAGTNIDLTGVPTALYAGGFHNFNPNTGQQDTAQTWSLPGGGQNFIMQWDDPYDQSTHSINDVPALYSNNGTIDNITTSVTFSNIPPLTAGQLYEVDSFHTSGDMDSIVTVRDPSNNVIVNQDTTIDEVVHFFAPASGVYTVTIGRFGATTGNFHIDVYHSTGYSPQLLTTNINLLTFRIDTGAYVSTASLTADNFATNQPIENGTVTRPSGQTGVQFMIARSNVPASGGPTHVRMADPGNGAGSIGPMEYFTYDTVTTGGHATANGCNGTAAYSAFRPSKPETFTSPGPAIYYFDKMSNRLNPPQIRLQPRIAAADAANTSFFTSDNGNDGDSNPNFSGTSASGPHAAAIAGLVIQAHGGPGSLTPDQTRDILQRSTFPHDLDPLFASGTATASNGGTVMITINSDASNIIVPSGTNPAITGGIGMQDPNTWKVAYSGPGSLTSLVFNAAGTAATAGSPTSGNNGLVGSGSPPSSAPFNYFSNVYPGVVFTPATKNFTLGNLNGLVAGDITPPQSTSPFTGFSNLAPLPSNGTNQFWTMAIGFPTSNFTNGKSMNFTVGRGQQHSSAVGTYASPTGGTPFAGPNSGGTTAEATADLLGGGVLIPEGTVTTNGMAFSGTITDGANTFPFSGTINNRIGSGYSVQDGYGFINAEAAVAAPATGPSAVTFTGAVSRKNHPGVGNLDIALPGVECRTGGASGDFSVVFKFGNALNSVGFAQVINGNGTVASTSISGSEYTVNLTGVTNAQRVDVVVVDVADSAGNKSPQFQATLSVLRGDTTGDGSVNSADIGQTKSRSGNAVDGTNFRSDVTVDGNLNSGDIGLVKQNSGTALP